MFRNDPKFRNEYKLHTNCLETNTNYKDRHTVKQKPTAIF